MVIEEKITKMGLDLPEVRPMRYKKSLVRAVRTGNLVFVSGTGPYSQSEGKLKYCGQLGKDLSPEEGYEAAKLTALNILTALKEVIGDLDKVTRIVQLMGYLNVSPEYSDEKLGYVINGASDLLVELYGEERGRHSRASIGVAKLGSRISVEITAIFEVKD